jgi:MoxR-like ATPase
MNREGTLVGTRLFELELERTRFRAVLASAEDADTRSAAEDSVRRVDEELAACRSQAGDSLRDARLTQLLRLTPAEVELLWNVVAATIDPLLAGPLRDLSGLEARRGLSLATHARIAGLSGSAARGLALTLTSAHPLIRYGLLAYVDDSSVSVSRPLVAAPRVAAYLAGDNRIDQELVRTGGILRVPGSARFDDSQRETLRRIAQALAAPEPVLVLVEGPAGVGKRTAAATAALAAFGPAREVIQLDVTRLGPSVAELTEAFTALRRECLLSDALPLVANVEDLISGESERGARLRALAQLFDETPIPLFVTSTRGGVELGTERRVLRVALPVPETKVRRDLWLAALGGEAHANLVDLNLLAVRYRVGAGRIERAVAAAGLVRGAPASAGVLTTHHVIEGVRNGIAEGLGGLARRIEVKQAWNDLVLADDTMNQVRALAARLRHAHLVHEQWGFASKLPRGIGVAALFSGPPGTGKTMVAGLLAQDLDLELYQVDLSNVVSKWIGETEKQLAKIFEAAEAGHALLLFDEADALFAKRTTEVKSATDRYANLEVNYLLQRIETFGGLTILTTNLNTSIDPALRRRLAAHVVFYTPDLDERITLWKRMMATDAPVKDPIDYEALARAFPHMTGANVRNAVLAAAFLAAAEGCQISQQHLVRAGAGEYRAMGRILLTG